MASQSRRRAAGFTLVELMVVISIIVIIASASIPMGLNFVRVYRLTGAAQGVAAEIQRARQQAVKQNTSKGVLFVLNYPSEGQYQIISLDPDPRTGAWDGNVYPGNPGNCDTSGAVYGTVPTPPNNVIDPDLAAGVQSPHGIPATLYETLFFEAGERNALLFCSDGRVAAVTAAGPIGTPALAADRDAFLDTNDWLITLRDTATDLTKDIRVRVGGRVDVED